MRTPNTASAINTAFEPASPICPADELVKFVFELLDKNGPEVSDYANLLAWFNTVGHLREMSALSASEHEILIASFGNAMREGTLQGFSTIRPNGYAGDFEIIDKIYRHHLSPDERLVRWDKFFHAQASTKAVRNRKALFLRTLAQELLKRPNHLRVLIIGSGPGRDVLEHFAANPESRITFDCVEQDARAIAYASNLTMAFAHGVRFLQRNALRFHTSDRYDFIWAGGIFDYFSDRVFMALLRRLRMFLADGGELVVGNFSQQNPTRAYMEFGGWILNHRSSDKLRSLAFTAGLQDDYVGIEEEPEGVNLFLRIRNGPS
jgi:extracellular factor (EF) 3-hydroxypalmitic acid methyl ester biosynthesis protein